MAKRKQLVAKVDKGLTGIGYMLMFLNMTTGQLLVGGLCNAIDSAVEIFTELRSAFLFRDDYIGTGAVDKDEALLIFEVTYDPVKVEGDTHDFYSGLILKPKSFELNRVVSSHCKSPVTAETFLEVVRAEEAETSGSLLA